MKMLRKGRKNYRKRCGRGEGTKAGKISTYSRKEKRLGEHTQRWIEGEAGGRKKKQKGVLQEKGEKTELPPVMGKRTGKELAIDKGSGVRK